MTKIPPLRFRFGWDEDVETYPFGVGAPISQNFGMPYHVYILASHRKTLYTGVTSNLTHRLSQHAEGRGSQFAAKYNVNRLVFAEEASTRMEAVAREKQIKRWRREKKLSLIESINPHWVDLTNTPL
jgi:putative endonuclease